MKIRFFNIVWDTDGHETELPTEIELECSSDLNPSYDGADLLSDKYGWCVESFDFTILKVDSPQI